MTKRVLLTGATGFVGQHLLDNLLQQDVELYVLARQPHSFASAPSTLHWLVTSNLADFQGQGLPEQLDTIIHLAGRAHVTEREDEKEQYINVNVTGTERLVEIALSKSVRHFIYMSSVKVSEPKHYSAPLREEDQVNPVGIYAQTKYQAESSLNKLAAMGTRVSVIRPPLVYGPGVKANMAHLVSLVRLFPILPFVRVKNRRSIIGIRNLISFINTLAFCEPKSAYMKAIFFVADKESVSTHELCQLIARSMGKYVINLPLPATLLKFLCSCLGKRDTWSKVAGSLEVLQVNAKTYWDWHPPYTTENEIDFLLKGRK